MWGQLSTSCSNVLKQPTGGLLVAVNHNQLRTMASETVDPINWSLPPPSWAVSPERLVHSINQCNLSGTWTCNRSMLGNHLAYAATQGMSGILYAKYVPVTLPQHSSDCNCSTLLAKYVPVTWPPAFQWLQLIHTSCKVCPCHIAPAFQWLQLLYTSWKDWLGICIIVLNL